MAFEDRLGDESRSDAVSDPVERFDALRPQRPLVPGELEEERLVREPLRDEDDGVRLELERLAEVVAGGQPSRLIPVRRTPVRMAIPVSCRCCRRSALQRFVRERRDQVVAGDELDSKPSATSFSARPGATK